MADILPIGQATQEQACTLLLDLRSAIEDVLAQHGARITGCHTAAETIELTPTTGMIVVDFEILPRG